MQTFVPYPDLQVSCQVLDSPRLGKQRVETFQILRALTWPGYAWKNHPAVRMWRGFVPGLVRYGVENCREWVRRGHADSVLPQLLDWTGGRVPEDPALPPWWGDPALHLSHRARLVAKDPAFYLPLFGDLPDLPYVWPTDAFPRWPLRTGGRALDLEQALDLLGHDVPLPGQAEAFGAVTTGRDALLVVRPGAGATTAALLAGLGATGPVLRVLPDSYPDPEPVPDVPLLPRRDATPDPAPAATAPAPTAPSLARPPSPADAAAVRAEQGPPEWVLTRPDRLPPLHGFGLVVLEDADRQGALDLPPDRPPVLAVADRADAAERATLTARLGLRDPLHAGGGWDVGAWLGVVRVPTPATRRRVLTGLVVASGPALVRVAGRDRADRTTGALVQSGLRAATWDAAMRPTRAARAVADWRTRRLDALVVPGAAAPPLGRARVRLLVDETPPDALAWREAVAAVDPSSAVLLIGPDSPADLQELAGTPGCRRAALLARFGQPVVVPCGRCDVCAPGSGPVLSADGAGRAAAPRRA